MLVGNGTRLNSPTITPDIRRCPADFNALTGINSQDIFDYLAAWFAGC